MGISLENSKENSVGKSDRNYLKIYFKFDETSSDPLCILFPEKATLEDLYD
jgi:hypothetical protein